MPLSAGARLGAYEIRSLLGAGGMGEVYRATDTRLSRDVAVKILPEAFASDAERLARFEREARLLASLNHPGIATLHGLEEAGGSRLLVMELVEGETLGGRIARGPMPIDEALLLFGQIAGALEAAHEKGIVHRDLKPGNVMVTPEEKVKLLDFGLAKAFDTEASATDLSHSPTITRGATQAGVILGTAAYMSPEQARGKATDKRTDIWAFGCCLYEALTGLKPFPGETVTDVLAAIVRSEPDWAALPLETPPRLRELLRRCLQKDPRERLRDVGDARIELAQEPVAAGSAPARRRTPVWVAAAVLAAVAIGLLLGRRLFSKSAAVGSLPVMRSTILLPEGQRMPRLWYMPFAISEDGTRLAYAALTKDGVRLYRRSLDASESTPVAGTEDVMMPFFSPDGEWIGFFAGGKLKKVAWAGGAPVTLATARVPVGGTWGADGTIVFAPTQDGGLWRVSAEGGPPEELTRPDFHDKGYGHSWPQYVDGGKRILFVQWGGHPDGLSVLDLASRKWSAFLPTAGMAGFVPTGHILFGDLRRGPGLFGARFDPEQPGRMGPAIPVLEGVRLVWSESGRAWVAYSKTGTLLYGRETLAEGTLLWQGRQGLAVPIWKRRGPAVAARLSPDGRSIAFDDSEGNLRILDVERGVDRIVVRRGENSNSGVAVWAPDGKRLAFCSNRGGNWDLYEVPVEGGEGKKLFSREFDQCPGSWVATPTGSLLAYYEYNPKSGFDIGLVDDQGKLVDSIVTEFNDASPALSPGAHLLAFTSDRSGRRQVYLRKLGVPTDTQVSLDGGCEPAWSRDGKQLFFRNGDRVLAVNVSEGPDPILSTPSVVLEAPFDRSAYSEQTYYDVAPDGRFLVATDASATELQVVTNWFQELERLAPAK